MVLKPIYISIYHTNFIKISLCFAIGYWPIIYVTTPRNLNVASLFSVCTHATRHQLNLLSLNSNQWTKQTLISKICG